MGLENELGSQLWLSILETGFGAYTFTLDAGINVTVFRKGPLGVGYINFPVGIRTREAYLRINEPDALDQIKKSGVDLLRLSVPDTLGIAQKNTTVRLPEVAIPQLANWSEELLESNLRYKIRRARREGVLVRPAQERDAEFVSLMYQETVRRHGGNRRYTDAYFHALCKASETHSSFVVLIATTPGGERCGFIVTANQSDVTYYLHGGMDEHYSQYRPGYVLMCDAIAKARSGGANEFNLMTSPVNQPSLTRFKEKWGGLVYDVSHIDIPLSILGRFASFGLSIRSQPPFQGKRG